MQSLAAFTGADYRAPGTLDYVSFLRATQICTHDVREMRVAFERAVFNVAFNNRDDHPKNFSYLMAPDGHWSLAPAYDVTFAKAPADIIRWTSWEKHCRFPGRSCCGLPRI